MAVKNVSIDVMPGQTVAVVGESGSGKSSTAAAINGLLPGNGRLTNGEVWFEGRDLAALGERDMQSVRGVGIGLVPQDPMSNLNPLMRIGEQIAEALEVHGIAKGKAAKAQVIQLLEMVGIPDPAAAGKPVPARVLRWYAPAGLHRDGSGLPDDAHLKLPRPAH